MAGVSTLMKIWGNKCVYCGVPVFIRPNNVNKAKATVDHFIPKSKGGGLGINNLVLCCVSCNSAKTNTMPQDFLPMDKYSYVCSVLHKMPTPIHSKKAPFKKDSTGVNFAIKYALSQLWWAFNLYIKVKVIK